MKTADREALAEFREESEERLDRIAAGLKLLAGTASVDPEQLHSIFRETHSLKSGANLLHLGPVEQLCHKLEDILESIRNGSEPPDRPLIEILSAGYGRINALLENLHLLSFIDADKEIAEIERRLAARRSR